MFASSQGGKASKNRVMNAELLVPGIANKVSSIRQIYEAQFSIFTHPFRNARKGALRRDRLRQPRSDVKQTVQSSIQLDLSENRARKRRLE
jgi:hypothetical protein